MTQNNSQPAANQSGIPSWIAFVVICFLTSAAGAFFPPGEWYASLNRPFYAPPNWVFGPVWTVLYLMIATSGWLVWRTKQSTGLAMSIYAAQLVLNGAWTCLFFGLQRPGVALIEIAILFLLILATILVFRRYSKTASFLLIPYLLWVSFATVLNYGFWSLNP